MGIMTRLYHRSDGLSENPYKYFFLDMGENIHIHYRDLRIELSVQEFLEFAEVFERCTPAVKKKIDAGYMDGVLPNTNESNTLTTIALDAPLKHPVKYNSNRVSIEENVDGYHIHLRNYKFLFDKKSFGNILQAMNDVVERRNSQRSLDEVLNLIGYNDLEFQRLEVNRDITPQTASVGIEPKYIGKLNQVFKALGFERTDEGKVQVFRGTGMVIRAHPIDNQHKGNLARTAGSVPQSPYCLLADYLTAMKGVITPTELNLLKLQVLNAFGMVRTGENRYINLDSGSFLLDRENQRVIFQATAAPHEGDTAKEYQKFSKFLHELSMFFVKPNKVYFSEQESEAIWDITHKHLLETIATNPCVSRIYVLGSATRSKMGKYEVPFVHFDWAKLASDIDILIEIDEQYPIPEHWQKKFFTDYSGSYYYHLGDVPHQVDSPYVAQYPNVVYFRHLIEAYLFFPSSGKASVKDKYLESFKAEQIYAKPEVMEKKKK